MINSGEKKNLFITFQPLASLENVQEPIKSNNRFLDDYINLVGYRPIFSISLDKSPIEYILSDVLMSFPRQPEIAIIFEKDMDEVDVVSRLDVFKFDNYMDNGVGDNNLTWDDKQYPPGSQITSTIKHPYIGYGMKDYLVENIKKEEIIAIYRVTEDVNSVTYDNLYRYNHLDFIQWVVESLTISANQVNKSINLKKIPYVDTNTEEFVEYINILYNQLIYKPHEITDSILLQFENIMENWLYDKINAISEERFFKQVEDEHCNQDLGLGNVNYTQKPDSNLGQVPNEVVNERQEKYRKERGKLKDTMSDIFEFYGEDIEPFKYEDELVPSLT